MKRTYQASTNLDKETTEKVLRELKLGYLNLEDGFFDEAETNFRLSLEFDPNCADAWWGLSLSKFQISNEDQLFSNPMQYKNITMLDECKNALEFADNSQKNIFKSLLESIDKINEGDNY